MNNVFLVRSRSDDDQGIIGKVMIFGDHPFNCYSLELPWRDNKSSVSCIPDGMYTCTIRKSNKFGVTFHVKDVPDRSYVLIHSGNYAGDVSKGWKTHSHGCILLGRKAVIMNGQKAVTNSRSTLDSFMRIMGEEDFLLHIIKNY